MKEIEITLNPAISPQQNAAKFYKDYQKAKNAEKNSDRTDRKGVSRSLRIWRASSTRLRVRNPRGIYRRFGRSLSPAAICARQTAKSA